MHQQYIPSIHVLFLLCRSLVLLSTKTFCSHESSPQHGATVKRFCNLYCRRNLDGRRRRLLVWSGLLLGRNRLARVICSLSHLCSRYKKHINIGAHSRRTALFDYTKRQQQANAKSETKTENIAVTARKQPRRPLSPPGKTWLSAHKKPDRCQPSPLARVWSCP
jgi:hypothetical protein